MSHHKVMPAFNLNGVDLLIPDEFHRDNLIPEDVGNPVTKRRNNS